MNCTLDCKRTVSFVRKLSLFKSDTLQRDEISKRPRFDSYTNPMMQSSINIQNGRCTASSTSAT